MRPVRARGVFAVAAATLLLSTHARSDIPDLGHSELISACLEAIERGLDATPYADELASRKQFHLGEENVAKGKQCLETAFGATWEFSGGRFSSPELDAIRALERERFMAAAEARAKRREAERAARERKYLSAVVEICREEYRKDRFRALTTPICGTVFKEIGLPE